MLRVKEMRGLESRPCRGREGVDARPGGRGPVRFCSGRRKPMREGPDRSRKGPLFNGALCAAGSTAHFPNAG